MARPERNTVDYFPFYCDEGKKMFYLEETYGNDGFATFLKILRELAKTDYHYLDLSKSSTMMFLSAKCKVSKDVLEAIINDLVELEKFDGKLWNDCKVVWCQDFIDSIQDAYKKRNNNCITYEGLGVLLISLGIRKPSKSKTTVPVNTQRKEKEIKEKNTILDNTKEKGVVYPYNTDSFIEKWNLWKNYKKDEHKFNYKGIVSEQAALKKLAELSNNNEQIAIKIILNSISNGWAGLFTLEKGGNGNNNTTETIEGAFAKIDKHFS